MRAQCSQTGPKTDVKELAYDPADLRLPPWLLRLLDALIRLRIPVAPSWQLGMTRPGVLLAAVMLGLWLAAFYSGNNLLYLCGAMLTALVTASIWQGVRLLKSMPLLASQFPDYTQAGDVFVFRREMPGFPLSAAYVEVEWNGGKSNVPLQTRLERTLLLAGKLKSEQRGVIGLQRQLLKTTAPLGLWQISRWRDDPVDWLVLPKPVPWAFLREGNREQMQAIEGDELRDLRSYIPGDSLSRIHWRKAAADMTRWSVKRFEQHAAEAESIVLRVDLRLPDRSKPERFEELLGRAWYWIASQLQGKEGRVVLGQQHFDLSRPESRPALFRALAEAVPENTPAAGEGGILLSLVEQS